MVEETTECSSCCPKVRYPTRRPPPPSQRRRSSALRMPRSISASGKPWEEKGGESNVGCGVRGKDQKSFAMERLGRRRSTIVAIGCATRRSVPSAATLSEMGHAEGVLTRMRQETRVTWSTGRPMAAAYGAVCLAKGCSASLYMGARRGSKCGVLMLLWPWLVLSRRMARSERGKREARKKDRSSEMLTSEAGFRRLQLLCHGRGLPKDVGRVPHQEAGDGPCRLGEQVRVRKETPL